MDPSRFNSKTLGSIPQGESVCKIMAAAIQAVEPASAVRTHLRCTERTLSAGQKRYDLQKIKRIFLVGAGKAGAPMASAAAEVLGTHLYEGIMIVKHGCGPYDGQFPETLRIIEARHPIPDRRGLSGTHAILNLLKATTPEDLVICLLSGGASALMTLPAPGITLTDIQRMTDLLLRSGATIHEINTLRKHLDNVKGGGLARAAAPAQVLSLILSDVVGDQLDVIASGPTAVDESTYFQAMQIVKRYELEDRLAPSILNYLKRGINGEIAETLKPVEAAQLRIENIIIGSNRLAIQAALDTASKMGFNTQVLTTTMQGEARQAGQILSGILRDVDGGLYSISRPACIIAGGETTVTVTGTGFGGRNLELALAAVSGLKDLKNVLLITLATDGGDGPTDAAGAVVSGGTMAQALALGLSPAEYLIHNNSYPFFEAIGDLIKPGQTQTNTNDLVFIFAF